MLTPRRTAAALAAILVVTLLLAWWSKGRCLVDGGWEGGEEYSRWCYTDIVPLWYAEELHNGATPYVDHPVEYPVLIGAQMWVSALVVRAVVADSGWWAVSFYTVNVLIGAALYAFAAYRLRRMGVSPVRLLWFIAAPTFIVYAFMNWDALAVALAVAAVELHRRGRDAGAGIAAGLGAAAKLFPGFIVPIVVIARLRQGRPRAAVVHAAAAAGAWLAVNVPVIVAAPSGWAEFLRLNRARPADWDSLWLLWQNVRGQAFDTTTLNLSTLALFVVGAALIVAVGNQRWDASQQWRLLLPVVCWFLLTNKVYSPQFSVWLLPLMALALPGAATFAAFAVADLFVFAIRFHYLGGRQDLDSAPSYALFAVPIVVRATILLWVIGETLALPGPITQLRPSALDPPTTQRRTGKVAAAR